MRDEVVNNVVGADQREEISKSVINQLQDDGRIVSDGKKWYAKDLLPELSNKDLNAIFAYVAGSAAPVSTEDILRKLRGASFSLDGQEMWRFRLEQALRDDKRLIRMKKEGTTYWELSPPQNEAIVTVDESSVYTGSIKITSGLRQMLAYHRFSDKVKFITYGCFEIFGEIERDYKKISGRDIQDWYHETDVQPGNRIHIISPEKKGEGLRFYSDSETRKEMETKSAPVSERKRIFIRHLIYRFLKEHGFYCSKADIREAVEKQEDSKTSASAVSRTLLNNTHIFQPLSSSSSLWGLVEWGTEDKGKHVNLNSLLLAIHEDDLVYKIINAIEEPLSTREIATRIAQEYCLAVDLIMGLSFLDPHDKRFLKLPNEKWSLAERYGEWKKSLNHIESRLALIDKLETEKAQKLQNVDLLSCELQTLESNIDDRSISLLKEKETYEDMCKTLNGIDDKIEKLQEDFDVPIEPTKHNSPSKNLGYALLAAFLLAIPLGWFLPNFSLFLAAALFFLLVAGLIINNFVAQRRNKRRESLLKTKERIMSRRNQLAQDLKEKADEIKELENKLSSLKKLCQSNEEAQILEHKEIQKIEDRLAKEGDKRVLMEEKERLHSLMGTIEGGYNGDTSQ